MDNRELLKVEKVYKSFRKNKNKMEVLKDISFSLMGGECLGIIGESGCGKSTLARIITGIEKPSSGSIYFDGESLKGFYSSKNRDIRRNIQMIFQEPSSSFSPRMTIGDYLWEPLRNYNGINKKNALPIVEEILEKVGAEPSDIGKYPHQFSGGQLQRIVIARAVIINPKLIICDEATSALDVSIQGQILELLETMKNDLKLSYIFIGHDLAVVQKMSNRIAVMYSGEIIEILDSRNFIRDAEHPYTRKLIEAVFEV